MVATSGTSVIRWGIVGAGSVCEVKSGPAFYKAPGSSVVAVMRRSRAKAEDFAKRHNIPRFYDDLNDLLQDPELDAVYVATPPGTHKDIASRVCAAGKPCYVEKPMARNSAECIEMIDLFKKARLPLYIGYYRRYLPKFVHVKSLIDSGTIGRVTSVNLCLAQFRHKFPGEEVRDDWRVDACHAGGGLFMDLGSHQLDLLDHLIGPLQNARGTARRLRQTDGLPGPSYAVEDVVSLTFDTPSGALGTASWNFCSGKWEDKVDIIGDLGSVSFSCFNNTPVRLEVAAKLPENGEGGSRPKRLKEPMVTEHQAEQPEHVHQPLVEALLADLRAWMLLPEDSEVRADFAVGGQDRTCHSTAESAARTAVVMDRALEGFYGGPRSRDGKFWETPDQWQSQAK